MDNDLYIFISSQKHTVHIYWNNEFCAENKRRKVERMGSEKAWDYVPLRWNALQM